MRILTMLVAQKTRKIYTGVAINGEIIFRVKNVAMSSCAFEIAHDMLEGSFMRMFLFKSVLYTGVPQMHSQASCAP